MSRSADSARVELWRGRLTRQRRSRLSIAEFCRREDVSEASFYAWRKRLKEVDGLRSRSPLFVPVNVSGIEKPVVGLQIELPGGAVVKLPTEASAELVTTAIRAATSEGTIEETRP